MNAINQTAIFIARILWITIKYSPILLAWLIIGFLVIDMASQMHSATVSRPPMSTAEQLGTLVGLWFVVTGAAALKYIEK